MPLSVAKVKEIQAECFAEDVPLPAAAHSFTEKQLIEYFESGGKNTPFAPNTGVDSAGPVEWEVIFERVVVRDAPSTTAKALGMRNKGDIVTEVTRQGDWLQVEGTGIQTEGKKWMLIDGTFLKLGKLLRPLRTAEPRQSGPTPSVKSPTPGDLSNSFLAPICYEVVHTMVNIRESPSVDAKPLGVTHKGDKVLVSGRQGDWLMLSSMQATGGEAFTSGWMLHNGASVGLRKALLTRYEEELPGGTSYQVTRSGTCEAYEEPGGVGVGRPLHSLQEGTNVEVVAECGHWVKLKASSGPRWVELDIFLAG
mmetsp:Transcript_46652/g.77162  ORF Transcript_46652/g.77162 Transcript_46652/m.77162 type:complete len:309 (-) Transcript_46652:216-1142(-)|eukprot:CAMPEP_0119314596 /NCGR_PEP_ID=MMETSP1333-20130426/33253_1 /TAXON_ID=418940 /ORGANISM="Scyphosphaera apsteinii, Strain RCC1455" /LENGTH=308 /DNA_ID=CAMNT_0007319739 /DNA_START=35 /DNA_END=961 /DNA_ORIENTATION=-